MREQKPLASNAAALFGSPSASGSRAENDPDDTWQADVAVQVGAIQELNNKPVKRRKKEPMGFDIRPGRNIRPQPHETWGPAPIIIWPGRK